MVLNLLGLILVYDRLGYSEKAVDHIGQVQDYRKLDYDKTL
jgi:hypothetical protein